MAASAGPGGKGSQQTLLSDWQTDSQRRGRKGGDGRQAGEQGATRLARWQGQPRGPHLRAAHPAMAPASHPRDPVARGSEAAFVLRTGCRRKAQRLQGVGTAAFEGRQSPKSTDR